jgi:DNA helicase-2/ATP-dependent DNA helicase PcrA
VEELRSAEAVTESRPRPASTLLLDAEALRLQTRAVTELPGRDQVDLSSWLADFRLSVSDLYRYLDCPVGFYYEQVLRAPHFQSPAATYGTALHVALQQCFDRMLADPEHRFPGVSTVVRSFEEEMLRRRGYFTESEYDRRLAMGRRHLDAYYRAKHADWPKQVRTELRVRHAEVDGVPLTGTIDLVSYRNGQEVQLIDYKTGRPTADRLRPPTKRNPYGGNYWRQLHFYKLLFENQPGEDRRATEGTISYVSPDDQGQFLDETLRFDAKDVQRVRTLIREVYTKISQGEFTAGCGQPDCQWCTFLREDLEVDSFRNPGVEELDD